MSRTGKIARLPEEIRKSINLRISDGIPLKTIAAELNEKPEIRKALEGHFQNTSIRAANLSEWKRGGYLESSKDVAEKTNIELILAANDNMIEAVQNGLSDRIAVLLAAHMVTELKCLEETKRTEDKAKLWRELRMGLSAMKRYEFWTLRRKQELKKLEAEKKEEKETMTPDQKRAAMRRILGLSETPTFKDFSTATWKGPDAEALNRSDDKLIAEGKIPPREVQIKEMAAEAQRQREQGLID